MAYAVKQREFASATLQVIRVVIAGFSGIEEVTDRDVIAERYSLVPSAAASSHGP